MDRKYSCLAALVAVVCMNRIRFVYCDTFVEYDFLLVLLRLDFYTIIFNYILLFSRLEGCFRAIFSQCVSWNDTLACGYKMGDN